jgi:hypothetical protein
MIIWQRLEPKKKLGFWIGFGWKTQNPKEIQNPSQKELHKSKNLKSKPKKYQ